MVIDDDDGSRHRRPQRRAHPADPRPTQLVHHVGQLRTDRRDRLPGPISPPPSSAATAVPATGPRAGAANLPKRRTSRY
ncbi:hypothetical protein C731_3313 [Mycolicibacterium hassiacum DSM 44199]|uniref:Uncharacterized protein n=1 Tax=Mycolicibacterium hassiacum (strain DSM 44199 / CIP 105218 / JCM 12690 / 3849) TaxID=1122247 RepID=K5B7U8_MYCHD|nr:hypothetical protein C731_3313 [Mycolicibacterium hassiacum DSM 44199]